MLAAMRIWLTILVGWPEPAGPWRTSVLPRDRAGGTLVADRVAHALDGRRHRVPYFLVAADHDGQGGVLGAHIAAGDGSVEAQDALRLGRIVDLARPRGLRG